MPEQKNGISPESQVQTFKSRITKIVNAGKARIFGRSLGGLSSASISQTGNGEGFSVAPETVEGVLESIDPRVPDVFRPQAREAARYIQLLDQGLGRDDPRVARFLNQLQTSGFITSVYIDQMFGNKDSKKALPVWLQKDFQLRSADRQKEAGTGRAFSEWVRREKFDSYTGQHGEYFVLDNSPRVVPKPRAFKCYIEGNVESKIQNGSLPAVFRDLKETHLNPNEMKLFENSRLVLYYFKDVNLSDNIRAAFLANGLDFRGPAQDVCEIEPTPDGQIKLEVHTSNDGALGEGGHSAVDYELAEYSQAEFLDNYLQLCVWAGKDPREPYKTSFVYFVDTDRVIKDRRRVESLMPQAEKMAGYPVVYTRHRLDIAKK